MMNKMRAIVSLFLLFPLLMSAQEAPRGLRVDLLEHPDSIFVSGQQAVVSSATPYFSWECGSGMTGGRQAAWRILVASNADRLTEGKADVWDSGRQKSSISTAVCYGGKALRPSSCYFWTVQTFDRQGNASSWAVPQSFRTAPVLDGSFAYYPLTFDTVGPVSQLIAGDSLFVDFGLDAFGTLRLELDEAPTEVQSFTVLLGEKRRGNQVDETPSGTIRFARYELTTRPGQRTYIIHLRKDARNTTTKINESGMLPVLMPDYIGEVMPFRYAAVIGLKQKVRVSRTDVHYPFDSDASSFESSDPVLNAVWQLCKHSMKATSFCGLYVDGDRERISYEADAFVNQLSHYAVDAEYSMARRTVEHLILHPTWPTEWILLTPLLAWNDYLYTGDDRLLRRYYDDISRKTLSALADSTHLISTRTGRLSREVMNGVHYRGKAIRDIVDWPQGGAKGIEKEYGGETDGFVFCNYNAVVNAYYFGALGAMEKISKSIGRKEDAKRYARQMEILRRAYYKQFYDERRGLFHDGDTTLHCSLHTNMFALAFGLVKPADRPAVARFCESRGMACSVYGAQFLLDALYENGLSDYAYTLLTSTRKRSWWNMLRMGSTITTEAWDNVFKPNLDWNHAWGAAAGNIIVRRLLGIRPTAPGFASVVIQPEPGALKEVNATVPTVRGPIAVHFLNPGDGTFTLDMDVPDNVEASVILPGSTKAHKITAGKHRLTSGK